MASNADKSILLLVILKHKLTQGERAIGFAARATEAVPLLQTTYSDYTVVSMIQAKDTVELNNVARDTFGVTEVLPIEGPDVGMFGVKVVDTSVTEALPSSTGSRRHRGLQGAASEPFTVVSTTTPSVGKE